MRNRPGLLLIMIILCCRQSSAGVIHTQAHGSLPDSLPGIIIAGSFDAMLVEARKNKRELLRELTDSLEKYLSDMIKEQTGRETIIIPGLLPVNNDSIVYALLLQHHAGRAILVRSLDVSFVESGSAYTQEYGEGPKISTKYDLCSHVEYSVYNDHEMLNQSTVEQCRYFTTRSVKDKGFQIQFGPDIVGKKKHTYGIMKTNAGEFLTRYGNLLAE